MHSKKAVTISVPVYWHRRNPTSTTFRYHEYYLSETKEYYKYYYTLFEELASEYIDKVRIGLDGQYIRRCMSAIERELFMSPKGRTTRDMCSTIDEICNDDKFKPWFTFKNINKNVSSNYLKLICFAIKCGICFPVVFMHNLLMK